MKDIYFLTISRENTALSTQPHLMLCGENISFLNPILKNSTLIEQSEDFFTMKVTFFKGSRFSQTLESKVLCSETKLFCNKNQLPECKYPCLGKVVIATEIKQIDVELIKNISWFIRGSETLKQESLKELPNEWRIIDGRGMALLEKYPQSLKQSCRQLFLVMLGLAYYYALQQINEELSRVLAKSDNTSELDQLYSDASIFNASYYFYNPIEFSRYATFRTWQDVREAYHLEQKNKEITSQLAQVHQILSYTEQKNEQILDKLRDKKIAWFGGIISALSLFEVIDVIKNWFS
ncbi:hypothetical protein [Lonepinella sp. MS14437]|uniref:hypothetical protein n=1 Tax=unclassified Lonepinella TaxID=2642006 RepID=UPI0036DA8B07